MSPNEAKLIIEALASGVDPETGEVISTSEEVEFVPEIDEELEKRENELK